MFTMNEHIDNSSYVQMLNVSDLCFIVSTMTTSEKGLEHLIIPNLCGSCGLLSLFRADGWASHLEAVLASACRNYDQC